MVHVVCYFWPGIQMFHQSHLTIVEQTLQVVFPALEELVIKELPQITQIFDKELLTEESFRQLRKVNLRDCKLLVNVFPSNMLSRFQNLQELYAYNCDNMEVIISMKGEEEYNEAETKDNIILFPKLRTLRLAKLNNLKSFYSSTCEAQPLFNKQVRMSHILVLHVHPSAHTKKETIPKVYVFIYIDTIHGTN